jgi:signal transduction histidine kinase
MIALGIGGILITEMSINISRTYYELVAAAALEATLFTLGFLSLVKRIKAGQLWKNSLCYLIIKWFVLIFKHRKVTTKVAILYAGFSFVTLMLLGIAVGSGSLFGMFLWFVFAAGVGIWLLMDAVERQHILDGIEKITGGELEHKINSDKLKGSNKILAEAINNIGEGLHNAVDASVRNERLKTDLITNVSHDIKTPLTSIINYVDLLKRENIDNEKVNGYIDILDQKSQRLKNLTEDLVEASKISSGNIKLEITKINFVELINQTEGEFSEKFEAKGLQVVKTLPNESVIIEADGRRIWRVIENLYNNVAKYAMPNTRVYVDLKVHGKNVDFSIKNISENPLNINADELTERFIRGDVSRSTEGSGLGLSIAKNLTTLQNGTFEIYLDGDLFRVTITFPKVD